MCGLTLGTHQLTASDSATGFEPPWGTSPSKRNTRKRHTHLKQVHYPRSHAAVPELFSGNHRRALGSCRSGLWGMRTGVRVYQSSIILYTGYRYQFHSSCNWYSTIHSMRSMYVHGKRHQPAPIAKLEKRRRSDRSHPRIASHLNFISSRCLSCHSVTCIFA